MLPIILMFILILYLVLIMYTYHSLKLFNQQQTIILIVVGILGFFLITTIIYTIMFNSIQSEVGQFTEEMKSAKWMLINIFTPVNGMIFLPYLYKNIAKYKEDIIDAKKFRNKILIRLILVVIFIIFEVIYIKDSITLTILQQLNITNV